MGTQLKFLVINYVFNLEITENLEINLEEYLKQWKLIQSLRERECKCKETRTEF